MVASLSELDYSALPQGIAVMLTLTYPADWEAVVPNGRAAKDHLSRFVKRYERKWETRLRGLWKMEFQRRGAPHFHLYLVLPCSPVEFREWVSEVWADVVAHPDPDERAKHVRAGTGLDFQDASRATDPRLLAIYFSKHSAPNGGSKEYQNRPPDLWVEAGSVGRFWGYWGLNKATRGVRVSRANYVKVARILRKWRRAAGHDKPRRVAVDRTNYRTGEIRTRHVRRRRKWSSSGFATVPEGSSFALALARYLSDEDSPPDPARKRPHPAPLRQRPVSTFPSPDERPSFRSVPVPRRGGLRLLVARAVAIVAVLLPLVCELPSPAV